MEIESVVRISKFKEKEKCSRFKHIFDKLFTVNDEGSVVKTVLVGYNIKAYFKIMCLHLANKEWL